MTEATVEVATIEDVTEEVAMTEVTEEVAMTEITEVAAGITTTVDTTTGTIETIGEVAGSVPSST